MQPISSLQNEKVKLVHTLQTRARARRKEGRIVLEGARLVRDAILRGHMPELVLVEPETLGGELLAQLTADGAEPIPVTSSVMRHVSATEQPQGVVAVFPLPDPDLPPNPQRVLILDGLSEPGNMGTILRTAAATGIDAVLLAEGCADPYNPKTLRGGMGAHFRVPVIQREWDEIGAYCNEMAVYLADSHGGIRYDKIDWRRPWAVIIGSEAHGACPHARELAHSSVCIPLAAETESLNAAVAAGVLLFEAQRQRTTDSGN